MSPAKNNNYTIEFNGIHQKHLIYSRTPKKHEIHCHPPKTIKYTLTGTHHSIYNTISPSKNNNYTIEFNGIHQKLLIQSRTQKHEMHCHPPKTIKYTLTGTHHSIYNTLSPSKNDNYTIEFNGIHQKHLIYSCTPKNMKYNVTHQKPLNSMV